MRCSSAVVLSTLAVGQAAAANVHNRHASFHARREAAKRGENNVNWDAVAYDLKDVKWDQVNWSSVFAPSAAKPTPTPEKPVAAAAVTPTPEPKKDSPAPSSTKPADTPKPATPSSKPDSPLDKASDAIEKALAGVDALASKLGYLPGTNSRTGNGGVIWISDQGKWGMDVTNKGSDEVMWYCWRTPPKEYSAAFVKTVKADISYPLGPGESVSLSFPGNIGTACSASKEGLPDPYGMIMNTWAEAHFGTKTPTFDVSRNPNMKGSKMTMKGKKCTSDFQNCAFQCKSGDSCTYGYELVNCGEHNGGHSGFDDDVQGTGGGCFMDGDGERLSVTFS